MKEGHITYKFKSESDYDTRFEIIDSNSEKTRLVLPNKGQDAQRELVIYDSKDSSKEYSNESTRISANSILVVERRLAMASAAITISSKSDSSRCPICSEEQRLILAAPCCGGKMCGFCLENGPNCQLCGKSRIRAMKYQVGHSAWSSGNTANTSNNNTPGVNQNELIKILNESRYFIIKSLNQENIMMAKQNCEWATTLNNQVEIILTQKKLIDAYNSTKHVILLFSVNKSSKFQGFARMESPPMPYSGNWKDKETLRLGGVFKIKWLKFSELSFSRLSHIKNPFNNNEPIKKSRDTQELHPDIGKEICLYFDGNEEEITSILNKDQQSNHQPVEALNPQISSDSEQNIPKNKDDFYDISEEEDVNTDFKDFLRKKINETPFGGANIGNSFPHIQESNGNSEQKQIHMQNPLLNNLGLNHFGMDSNSQSQTMPKFQQPFPFMGFPFMMPWNMQSGNNALPQPNSNEKKEMVPPKDEKERTKGDRKKRKREYSSSRSSSRNSSRRRNHKKAKKRSRSRSRDRKHYRSNRNR